MEETTYLFTICFIFFFFNLLSIYIFFFWDYYGFVLECVFVLEEKKALMLIGGFSILFHYSLLLNSILESHCQKKLINLCILLIEKQLPPLIARIVSCTVHVKINKKKANSLTSATVPSILNLVTL